MINQNSRDAVRNRARDLERNSDNVGAVVDAMIRNVVGTGIKLQAKVTDRNGNEDDALNDRIEELWRIWTRPENCDITGRMSLSEMEEMATRRRLVDGGLIILDVHDPSAEIPLKLQIKEVDELDTTIMFHTVDGVTHKVVGGLELDDVGKTVAYHFKEYGLYGWTGRSVRVEAEHVMYLSHRTRPTEVREFSPLATIIVRMRDLNQYMQAVSVKERILACLSVFISRSTPGRAGRSMEKDPATGYGLEKLSPGMIKYLDSGDKVEVVNPSGQASNAREYIMMMLRSIGSAMGLSYEATSRDMSQVNYSSARQGLIDDQATYKRWQNYLITHFLTPVYVKFITWCVVSGQLKIPDFFSDKERYTKCMFIPKGMPWIDPYKEARGNEIGLDTCQTTLEEICAAKGNDYREVIKQRAKEKKLMDELGLTTEETVSSEERRLEDIAMIGQEGEANVRAEEQKN